MKRGQEHEGMKEGFNFKRDERRNRSEEIGTVYLKETNTNFKRQREKE